jgi:hypothetical protein
VVSRESRKRGSNPAGREKRKKRENPKLEDTRSAYFFHDHIYHLLDAVTEIPYFTYIRAEEDLLESAIPRASPRPTFFLQFSLFSVFLTNMPFGVSFQKIDP